MLCIIPVSYTHLDVYKRQKQVFTAGVQRATIVFTMLPIMCIYPFLQKYFAKGIMVGAIKG